MSFLKKSLLTSMLIGGLACASSVMAQAAAVGSIQGSVVDLATGKGLDNATVRVISGAGRLSTTTDAKGEFIVKDVAAGSATMVVESEGYESSINGLDVAAGKVETRKIELKVVSEDDSGDLCS